MWLLLRWVCWSLGGTSGSKHRLLNGERTLAILRVPVSPERRKESAAQRFKSLQEAVIGAFIQSHDTKQGVKVCGNTSKPLRFGLPREPLQANQPTFRLVAFQSLVVMVTGLSSQWHNTWFNRFRGLATMRMIMKMRRRMTMMMMLSWPKNCSKIIRNSFKMYKKKVCQSERIQITFWSLLLPIHHVAIQHRYLKHQIIRINV